MTTENRTPEKRKGGSARVRIALEIAAEIEQAVAEGYPADRALAARFRAHKEYGSRDRRMYAQSVFALFRWRGWSGTLADEGPRALLRALWLDASDPDPAFRAFAENMGVSFAAARGWGGMPLRARAEALASMDTCDSVPSLAALVPDWVPGVLPPETGPIESWIETFQTRPPLWLRAAGIDRETLGRRLRENQINAYAHPVLAGAVRVDGHPHLANLAKSIGRCFEVQDLSAQAVIACATPRPGECWWDACAGSGGKALALAEHVGPAGRVLATDRRPDTVREMQRRIRASAAPGSSLLAQIHNAIHPPGTAQFDGVLLDAPCSGIGTWSRNPDARWRTPRALLDAYTHRQFHLLRAAADAVRPGGRLVYAVCTASRMETVEQSAAFLHDRPNFSPAPVSAPLNGAPAYEHWIHPAAGPCSGMYIAVFRREKDSPAEAPSRQGEGREIHRKGTQKTQEGTTYHSQFTTHHSLYRRLQPSSRLQPCFQDRISIRLKRRFGVNWNRCCTGKGKDACGSWTGIFTSIRSSPPARIPP